MELKEVWANAEVNEANNKAKSVDDFLKKQRFSVPKKKKKEERKEKVEWEVKLRG